MSMFYTIASSKNKLVSANYKYLQLSPMFASRTLQQG